MELQSLLQSIHNTLLDKGATLAVAESLTGGEISSLLTNTPGSSGYFLCGICAYANSAKEKLLGVSASTLEKHGAVSRECAAEMLGGIIKAAGSDYGISTTGIAGPTGDTPTKPIGLVYIAVGSKDSFVCREFKFTGKRMDVKNQAVYHALDILNDFLNAGKS
ncbi:MAG TPA: CinA family protein [Bacillota bacterium]|nr:CinA family protein [Bacillota bacterium]